MEYRRDAPAIRWIRRLLFLVCFLTACYGLVLLADADSYTLPISLIAGGDALGVLVLASASGLPAINETGAVVKRVALPLSAALLVQLVAGMAMFPLTREEGMSPDHSWFAVVPFVTLLIGGGSVLLAIIVHVMVLVPPITIVREGPRAVRGDPQARSDVGFAVLVLAVVAFAVAVVLALPESTGRRGIVTLIALLLGLGETNPDAPGWVVWVARALAVLCVGLGLLLARHQRRHRTVTFAAEGRTRSASEGRRPGESRQP